ncbi:MAG TPA: crotonase/enoyl-CoA hydratase family protein [Solirubrobacteraceae bacterium]|nr:crotonase/enoyl-CoA hydratase family protein [Solirubrobacteraceae bacterium]
MNDVVLTERHGGVLVITLNRPEVRNAVDLAMAEGIAGALDALDRDDAVVGVITGAGGTFCAGMDLKALANSGRLRIGDRGFAGITERAAEKPLIAAVEGFAVGGGLEIALSCDLIVAARDAKLGLPEVKRGLVAAAGGLLRLSRRVPYHVAMELALTGDLYLAERLYGVGLVNRMTEPGAALETALDLARRIGSNAPLSLQASKRILASAPEWPMSEAWQRQAEIAEPVFDSDDASEGARAFAEKRDPVWRGR